MSRHHTIPATPETMVWGYFEAGQRPVLEVESGDTVTLSSWPAGGMEAMPADIPLLPEHRAALEGLPRLGAHFITGPVRVRGARPGDVLQVDILSHEFPTDWGFISILPLLGALPAEFTEYETVHPRLDRAAGEWVMPWGSRVPAEPFFGILATTPPPEWGRQPSPPPRAFGGNMDNKALKPGTTLYLPVFVEGAGFCAGDGHGVQGDGEVCITAVETALTGTFRLTVRRDLALRGPFAEDADNLISIGLDEDLDDAAAAAVRQMVEQVVARTGLSRNHAYMLCSVAGDLRVTQIVDGVKGCHMVLPKRMLPRPTPPGGAA